MSLEVALTGMLGMFLLSMQPSVSVLNALLIAFVTPIVVVALLVAGSQASELSQFGLVVVVGIVAVVLSEAAAVAGLIVRLVLARWPPSDRSGDRPS